MSSEQALHLYLEKRFSELQTAISAQTVNLTSIVQDLQTENKHLELELKKRDEIIGDLRTRLAELTRPKNVVAHFGTTAASTQNPFNFAASTLPTTIEKPKVSFGARQQISTTPQLSEQLNRSNAIFGFQQQQEQQQQQPPPQNIHDHVHQELNIQEDL